MPEMDPLTSLLLTDLYEPTMYEAYLEAGMTELALFEFIVRKLPRERNFLVAAGLEQVLAFIEGTRFTGPELAWLEGTGRFRRRTLDHLANLRVTGEMLSFRSAVRGACCERAQAGRPDRRVDGPGREIGAAGEVVGDPGDLRGLGPHPRRKQRVAGPARGEAAVDHPGEGLDPRPPQVLLQRRRLRHRAWSPAG